MNIQNVIVEHFFEENHLACSGIFFNKRWVLFPAAIFLSTMKTIPDYIQDIATSKLDAKNYFRIDSNNIRVIIDIDKQTVPLKAQFAANFICRNLKNSNMFSISTPVNKNCNINLSLFVLLDVSMGICEFTDLLSDIDTLLKQCSYPKRGNGIFIDSSPFGNVDLISSRSLGIVSNCFGDNNCFFLTDASTAPGAEGGAIFTWIPKKGRAVTSLCGIVLSAMTIWRGESTSLTLGAAIMPLFSQLLKNNSNENLVSKIVYPKLGINEVIDSGLAQIFCGSDWGTGILLNKKNGIFLTAAHVVPEIYKYSVNVKWKDVTVPAYVVFRTKNSAYDLAVIQCAPIPIEGMKALKMASNPTFKGEAVMSAGFPIFHSPEDVIHPTLSLGNISKCNAAILHTTCTILQGTSGGAILRLNGELLGVVICHTVLPDNGKKIVFPKINMAVPIHAISDILNQYFKNNDASVLEELNCRDLDIVNNWRLLRPKL